MKISLILPYWDRKEAADAAITSLDALYGDLDLEVIVVDDGNRVRYVPPAGRLDIRVIHMPEKDEPKSCISAWNEGVRQATGGIVVLSCIEVLHERPVLAQLAESLTEPKSYAVAAAWCPEEDRWHAHSTVEVPECPPGYGLSFLAAIRRDFYLEIEGFDEVYRDGAGYEDRDFIHKLHKFGAKPVYRDDLVVVHPKSGATIYWGNEKFQRNRAIFEYKWLRETVHFVCLKAGTAFGPEYVNNLQDMVKRNLPLGFRGQFYCLTDDPTGLADGIEVLPLPADLEKWWGKLYLFKRGLFSDGARVIFMDLDTVIVGSLEAIMGYRGQFATLQDFYYPDRLGPAVMLWEAGDYTASIWEQWVAAGKPRHAWGDLWWLNNLDQGRFAKEVDRLQTIFPGQFCSFKAHCNPIPPKGTKVVCFHGQPRPHNCDAPWVRDVWRIGGGGLADLEIVSNTEALKVMDNVRKNIAREIPWLEMSDAHAGHAVIVAGGPSVAEKLDELRWRKSQGHRIIALNGAAHYLKRNGILADVQVILDSRPENAKFALPEVPEHFICSQCDPAVFDALEGRSVTVYHVNTASTLEVLAGGREAHLISTGSTVLLIAMGIAFTQGFRSIHLYGADSSYTDKAKHHAYEQKLNDEDRVIEAVVGGRTFVCAPWMVAQVQQFQEVAIQLMDADCTITVAGDGLLPHVARMLSQPQELAA